MRDLISVLLTEKHGKGWEEYCGVTSERLTAWKSRQDIEQKRQKTGTVDERLLYYADFYDIKTILKKNWESSFSQVFGKWKEMEILFTFLERYRDMDAHRRELLPHQKYFIAGISGEIRTLITKYRSKMETSKDCFPRIESAVDNLGNMCLPDSKNKNTDLILRPGDELQFTVTASDPNGDKLLYSIEAVGKPMFHGGSWQSGNSFILTIEEKHISERCYIQICIKSNKAYHASGERDDYVVFSYVVLPRI
jgi:hypothetical protein